ncbi:hypothetical protein GCM10007094_35900 [Pseudovibrio japonicus]|uniref:Uncharacterized protein n=1 Tax=Pseudovibrio japonicus TaxID=366534 RepID=A0ABQ3ENC1_9HYPH|nr:hypothetical protein [Pseudovibrio japonicus]GHB43294.1 hypothetical protein GCM10007094_35900 [Pseudovibrio japonicus]
MTSGVKNQHMILKNFLPSGRGLRMCTGASSVIPHGTLVLACLTSRFGIDVLNADELEPEGVLYLEPKRPVLCRITPIKP